MKSDDVLSVFYKPTHLYSYLHLVSRVFFTLDFLKDTRHAVKERDGGVRHVVKGSTPGLSPCEYMFSL